VRAIFCHMHNRVFRGHGVSRVMRKIVFHFCARCWARPEECEELMRRVTG
jgi:hypothetical protein